MDFKFGYFGSIFCFIMSIILIYSTLFSLWGIVFDFKFYPNLFTLIFFIYLLSTSLKVTFLSYIKIKIINNSIYINRPFYFFNLYKNAIKNFNYNIDEVYEIQVFKSNSIFKFYTNRVLFFKKEQTKAFLVLDLYNKEYEQIFNSQNLPNVKISEKSHLLINIKTKFSKSTLY